MEQQLAVRPQFKGMNVLITGASSGIGEELAYRFASMGATLILVARSERNLLRVAEAVKTPSGTDAHIIAADLAESGSAKRIFDETSSRDLKVDVLVNNAGQGKFGEFTSNDFPTYGHMLQLNVGSLTELCWLYLPAMKLRNSGGIINIASNIALVPGPYMAVYAASKSYVLKLSESLAGELIGTNVTVSCVCPGRTKTAFGKRASGSENFYDDKEFDPPGTVASAAIDAFIRKKVFMVTGPQKFLMTNLPRLLTRQQLIEIMSGIARKLYK